MMGFSVKQVKALRRNPDRRYVKTRQVDGRELSYLEGWYAVAEANRIFGFDGWNRETVDSRCVLARESRGFFTAVYVARVRLTVHAGGRTVVREGHGTGESNGGSPGEVHDVAVKAAETDATKRALTTFGRPFGLELYRNRGLKFAQKEKSVAGTNDGLGDRSGFHPDDTTPIPRPSRYYGRPRDPIAEAIAQDRRDGEKSLSQKSEPSQLATTSSPPLLPNQAHKIDKSELAISEPKRLRDKSHLRFVASQPCLVCGRQPSDAHHLRFAQPRAMGLKVSDEFTVPLCRGHHRQLHQTGNEQKWWAQQNIVPLDIARTLWAQTRARGPVADEPITRSAP